MSTLTKVLIVLLTVFSLFLCGIVVTYVANAENQKKRADGLQGQVQTAKQKQQQAEKGEADQKQAAEALQANLGKQLADANEIRVRLEGEIDKLKRENAQWAREILDNNALVKQANETMAKLRDQAGASQDEVKALLADQTNRKKELDETTQALMERMAVLADLEKKNRQLIEEKQGLETQLNQVLQKYGRAPVRVPTVTQPQLTAQPVQRAVAQQPTQAAEPQTRAINLNGRITQVDMKNKVASISIGTAAGVRTDMKFHVTRGDQFICDIVIFDADAEKAVGTLDLVQTEPQPGDLVTTNL